MKSIPYILIGILIIILLGTILPYIIPLLLILFLLNLFRSPSRKSTYTETEEYYSEPDYTTNDYSTSNSPKHDAIDVEYTERELDGDDQ